MTKNTPWSQFTRDNNKTLRKSLREKHLDNEELLSYFKEFSNLLMDESSQFFSMNETQTKEADELVNDAGIIFFTAIFAVNNLKNVTNVYANFIILYYFLFICFFS